MPKKDKVFLFIFSRKTISVFIILFLVFENFFSQKIEVSNHKYSLIDINGNIILDKEYDSIYNLPPFEYGIKSPNRLFIFKKENKFGFVIFFDSINSNLTDKSNFYKSNLEFSNIKNFSYSISQDNSNDILVYMYQLVQNNRVGLLKISERTTHINNRDYNKDSFSSKGYSFNDFYVVEPNFDEIKTLVYPILTVDKKKQLFFPEHNYLTEPFDQIIPKPYLGRGFFLVGIDKKFGLQHKTQLLLPIEYSFNDLLYQSEDPEALQISSAGKPFDIYNYKEFKHFYIKSNDSILIVPEGFSMAANRITSKYSDSSCLAIYTSPNDQSKYYLGDQFLFSRIQLADNTNGIVFKDFFDDNKSFYNFYYYHNFIIQITPNKNKRKAQIRFIDVKSDESILKFTSWFNKEYWYFKVDNDNEIEHDIPIDFLRVTAFNIKGVPKKIKYLHFSSKSKTKAVSKRKLIKIINRGQASQ